MRRLTWALVGLCVALACAALSWLSVTTIRLERAESEARARAALEERVRLALWRMDGRMARLVAQESTRGAEQWDPFYVPAHAYELRGKTATASTARIASPLLEETAEAVNLHFSVERAGEVRCTEAPGGGDGALARLIGVDERRLLDKGAQCSALAALMDFGKLESFDTGTRHSSDQLMAIAQVNAPGPVPQAEHQAAPPVEEQQFYAQAQSAQSNLPAQQGVVEYGKRQQQYIQNARPPSSAPATPQQQVEPPSARAPPSAPPRPQQPRMKKQARAVATEVSVSAMHPLWMSSDLLLVRRVTWPDDRSAVQGVWLDWKAVQGLLTAEVSDLLPEASLAQVESGEGGLLERQLASIPARLIPGPIPPLPHAPSTVPWILAAAWGSMLLSLVALGLLLAGALSLSERRAAFVSAVTHELRTPLTTFRMYAEMLSSGMVTDATQRATYYGTLERESNRLAHLVENVLAYARLEKKRAPKATEARSVESLLRDNLRRAEERAKEAGMTLAVDLTPSLAGATVLVEPAAAEQILFNLVDNACKYAREASDRRIHLSAALRGRNVALLVKDHGPGVDPKVAKHLFEPFSKSSEAAADSAPGVGLGLALCRRLAKAMGGDLRYEGSRTGACFALTLRRSA